MHFVGPNAATSHLSTIYNKAVGYLPVMRRKVLRGLLVLFST